MRLKLVSWPEIKGETFYETYVVIVYAIKKNTLNREYVRTIPIFRSNSQYFNFGES